MDLIKKYDSVKPTARAGHSSIIYGDKMYIFGGEDISGNSNDFLIFDLRTLTWIKVEV